MAKQHTSAAVVSKYQSAMNKARGGGQNSHREIMSDATRDMGDCTNSTPFWEIQLQNAHQELNTDM